MSLLTYSFSAGAVLVFLEEKFLKKYLSYLYEQSEKLNSIPRGYGLVIAINVVVGGFTIMSLGFRVAKARSVFIEKAKATGDKDAEERFSYPKLYAEGFSEEAKQFNCIQRSHQHALETFPHFMAMSMLGGLRHPILVASSGILMIASRLSFSDGYSTGEPKKRYQAWYSSGIWVSLLIPAVASLSTASALLLSL